jgi:hypothetical protein
MSFLQIQKIKDGNGRQFSYVHLASSVWRKKKKSPKQERIYIGRLDKDGREIIISKGFPARSGESIPFDELKRKVSGGEDIATWLQSSSALRRTSDSGDIPAHVEIVGDAHVLMAVAGDAGLDTLLENSFGREDGMSLLGLAFQQAVDARPLYLAWHWLTERTLPPEMKCANILASGVHAFVARVGADIDSREKFSRGWIRHLNFPEALICDTTSISSYSSNLELAEYGYNRDEENLPQVNLSMVATRDGIPLWCRAVPGSIPDVSTLKLNGEMLMDLGLERFTHSLDRGFYSQSNIRDMLREGLGFTIGVPFSVAQAKSVVRKHRSALMSPKRSFPFNGRIMRHVRDVWRVDMGKGKASQVEVHIFFEPACQAERMAKLEKTVFHLEDKAAKEGFRSRRDAFIWLRENASSLAKCFSVRVSQNGKITVSRKPRSIARLSAHMGYTPVITSYTESAPETVLANHRCRDLVEKLFDSLKNEDGQYRLRTGVDESVEGRLFLAFIALVMRASVEARMRKAGLLRKMTVADFFAQMRKIKTVHTKSGKRFLLEISKKNRELLAAVKIPLPS